MWGYGARHNALSHGALDPLMAKAIVIEAGDSGWPSSAWTSAADRRRDMMEQIRKEVAEKARVDTVMIAGSHSHHGPVIELTDREGFGKGKYDDAVAYSKQLARTADRSHRRSRRATLQPAKIGVAKKDLELNRNRHTKQPVQADRSDAGRDPLRLARRQAAGGARQLRRPPGDDADEACSSSRPTIPATCKTGSKTALGTNCVFMQGASGDMSPNRGDLDTKAYGEALGDDVVALAKSVETKVPEKPSIKAKVDRYDFTSRVDFNNRDPGRLTFQRAFFPELVNNFVARVRRRHRARNDHRAAQRRPGPGRRLGRVLLQPLEPPEAAGLRARHAVLRLLQRPPHVLPHDRSGQRRRLRRRRRRSRPWRSAPARQMMNQALVNLYTMLGKFPPQTAKSTAAN